MIGYYVHHHGHGHVMRATTLLPHLGGHEVTGFSTLPAPRGWPQLWIGLDPDADDDPFELPPDPTAGGVFHWVPRGHDGLRSRMATISRWIDLTDPDVVVVDTSVEEAALCRLHGVPVVQMLQPGVRTDRPHQLALDLADRIVAPWPADVAGVVLVNPAVASRDPRLKAVPVLKHVLPSMAAIGGDIKKPGVSEGAYDRTPLRALHSMMQLWDDVRDGLDRVQSPVLFFRSVEDHVVDDSTLALVREGVRPDLLTVVELTDSYHVATVDHDAPLIRERSAAFVAEITGGITDGVDRG